MTRGKGIIVLILLMDLVISHRTVSPFSSITKRGFTENVPSEVTLVASPSSLITAGWVEVQFSGVSEPNSQDWIGIYSPPTVDVTKTAPVRYQLAYVAAGYNSTGSGTLNFRLINIRDDYVFVFFKVTGNQQVAIGKSNIVSFKDYNQPLYGHISIGDSPSQMKVTWVSKQISNPMVQYGTLSENYSNNVTASSTTFKSTDLCGSPATDFGYRDPGFIHTAVLDNLVAGQQYFYIYGDSFGMSAEASFVAPPTPSPTQGVNLIAYGDMGKASVDGSLEHWEEFPSLNTTANVISKLNEIDLVLHIGDISYAVGYEAQWDQFFEQVEPVASMKPYMTCIGNHERDFPNSGSFYNGTDSGGECGVPYETYLPMPTPAADQPWYSFDYGNIHFLLMSTEHDFQNTSEQYQFIVNDLQQVQRSKTPWVIFAGHRPMYIDSTNNNPPDGDEPVAKLLRLHLEPVLLKYGVDMALWGHHHSYQRTCPVFQEECQDYGIVHVVIGMAGMGLSQNLEQTPPSWIEYVDDDNYGYTQIQTTENTLEMWYYSNTEGLKDNFIISKK